jgi:hypothetical protein
LWIAGVAAGVTGACRLASAFLEVSGAGAEARPAESNRLQVNHLVKHQICQSNQKDLYTTFSMICIRSV